jgi:hypothetical protein
MRAYYYYYYYYNTQYFALAPESYIREHSHEERQLHSTKLNYGLTVRFINSKLEKN